MQTKGKPPLWTGRGYMVQAAILWEPRDAWVGVFWDRTADGCLRVFICLVPCLPLRLFVRRTREG